MKRFILSICLVALVSPVTIAQVSGWQPGSSFDTKEARDARKNGAKPLSEIKASLKAKYGGKMLDATFTNSQRDTYRILWETGQGQRIKLEVDAATGRVK